MAIDDQKNTENSANEPIIIKKYANRRLYNTAIGEFITLGALLLMVNEDVIFVVQDANGKDITSSVLAQIIVEEEIQGHNILPVNMLRQLLKLYGDGVGPQFSSYLENAIENFTLNQQEMMKQMTDMFSANTGTEQWADLGRRNLELFQNSFMNFGGADAAAPTPPPTAPPTAPKPEKPSSDIDKLSEQLAEMQKQVDALKKNQ